MSENQNKLKICVLSGSPRGKYSTTLQTSLYLEKKLGQSENCEFQYFYVGNRISALEKDISPVKKLIEESDAVIFSYPVYTFLAPSQLHRFIAALKKSDINVNGKFVTQITTSKHFYDVTAHKYIEENCFDLQMKVVHGLSADMEDLLKPEGQKNAEDFFKYFLYCVRNDIYEKSLLVPARPIAKYKTQFCNSENVKNENKSGEFETVIVADLSADDENLKNMIQDFQAIYPYKTRLVNIAEYKFIGGCLGCFNCASNGKCIYTDNFDVFLREKIQTASSIVLAFSIKDHSMGPRFKIYDDRQFCNGHRTVTSGMSFGYIVNGDYEVEKNLQTVIEARSEVGGNFLAGVGYDAETIKLMACKMEYALQNKFILPRNFYGVGGMKIFRDLIYLMRGLMKSDHEYYKKHGIYDFPQKQRGKMILMCFLGAMVRNPKIKAKMGNKMNEGMIAPYKKLLEKM